MAVLSHDAQGVLDRYLRRMRASLRGHSSVDADDIERDVQGHIDAALAGQPEPIDASSLRQVLERLGAPDRWIPADDLSLWRRAVSRLWSGPEDWRLPYLTFLSFLAGFTLFLVPVENQVGDPGGPALWPLPIVLIIASFVFARASLSVLAASGESDETRRWLIYPPLLLWYVPLAFALFGWPIPAVLAANDVPSVGEWTRQVLRAPWWVNLTVTTALALGTWWIVLGVLIDVFKGVLRATFRPFADGVSRRYAIGLIATGGTLVAIAGVVIAFLTRR
jgi:hypothetical protein